jgi:hypothetical protein
MPDPWRPPIIFSKRVPPPKIPPANQLPQAAAQPCAVPHPAPSPRHRRARAHTASLARLPSPLTPRSPVALTPTTLSMPPLPSTPPSHAPPPRSLSSHASHAPPYLRRRRQATAHLAPPLLVPFPPPHPCRRPSQPVPPRRYRGEGRACRRRRAATRLARASAGTSRAISRRYRRPWKRDRRAPISGQRCLFWEGAVSVLGGAVSKPPLPRLRSGFWGNFVRDIPEPALVVARAVQLLFDVWASLLSAHPPIHAITHYPHPHLCILFNLRLRVRTAIAAVSSGGSAHLALDSLLDDTPLTPLHPSACGTFSHPSFLCARALHIRAWPTPDSYLTPELLPEQSRLTQPSFLCSYVPTPF